MSTITREWLQKTIAEFETTCDEIPFGMDDDDAKILQVLKSQLASLEASPDYYVVVTSVGVWQSFCKTRAEAECFISKPYNPGYSILEIYTGQPAPGIGVGELTMLVKRLAFSLRNAKPDSKLPKDAMSYLSKKGLISVADVLR
jgi:hypothetical protein